MFLFLGVRPRHITFLGGLVLARAILGVTVLVMVAVSASVPEESAAAAFLVGVGLGCIIAIEKREFLRLIRRFYYPLAPPILHFFEVNVKNIYIHQNPSDVIVELEFLIKGQTLFYFNLLHL